MPNVSAIIPAFNAERFVGEAILSVLGQTYQDFEITVIDDGSTDLTEEAVRAFDKEERLKYVRQSNRGPSAARNAGLKVSSGRLIAFLDADDVWLPGKLEAQVQALSSSPQPSVVYSDFGLIDDEGRPLPRTWMRGPSHDSLAADLMFGNVIAGSASSVLLPKEFFRSVGVFDEELWTCEDQDMWRRLAMVYGFLFLEAVHVLVRVHASQLQGDPAKMAQGRLLHLEKMERDTPPSLRHYLPDVEYATYKDVSRLMLRGHRPVAALGYLGRVSRLGADYVLRLFLDVGRGVIRRVTRRRGAPRP